ncbi:50S ribosomal protein L10 [Defluviitalea phaphyphila]|uniref:50S ribosomal protein L10 n=1 Tax=Defluviitalea phaphyphila TaxID=1473580 RepID=UPI00073052A5|nr:50S ribosomal protein L10 [Defluviitalea phaphyphila]
MAKIEQKQLIVNEIKEKFNGAASAVLVDYRGLTVEQDTELRKKLREAGVDYKVYKNTMMNFAVKDTEFEPLKDYLEGPSAIAFSYDDPTSGPRILDEIASKHKALEFKAGIVEGKLYDASGISKIAKIPPKEELLSKLLGSFNSPIASFARVVKAIAEKKEEGAEVTAE